MCLKVELGALWSGLGEARSKGRMTSLSPMLKRHRLGNKENQGPLEIIIKGSLMHKAPATAWSGEGIQLEHMISRLQRKDLTVEPRPILILGDIHIWENDSRESKGLRYFPMDNQESSSSPTEEPQQWRVFCKISSSCFLCHCYCYGWWFSFLSCLYIPLPCFTINFRLIKFHFQSKRKTASMIERN